MTHGILLSRIEEPEKQRDSSLSYEERRRIEEASYRLAFPRFGTLSSTVVFFGADARGCTAQPRESIFAA